MIVSGFFSLLATKEQETPGKSLIDVFAQAKKNMTSMDADSNHDAVDTRK